MLIMTQCHDGFCFNMVQLNSCDTFKSVCVSNHFEINHQLEGNARSFQCQSKWKQLGKLAMSIGTWLLKEFELISFIEISAKTFQNQSK